MCGAVRAYHASTSGGPNPVRHDNEKPRRISVNSIPPHPVMLRRDRHMKEAAETPGDLIRQAQYTAWGRNAPTPMIEGDLQDAEVLGDKTWPGRS